MGKTDYLPSNPLTLLYKLQNINAQVSINHDLWGISLEEATSLLEPVSRFKIALDISENPETRTPSTIRHREEMREAALNVFRPFIQGRLYHNPKVTESDILLLGLPVHDHKPTPEPDPEEEPEIEVLPVLPGVLEAKFGGRGEKGHAKPKGMHGVEMRWVIAETQPVNWSELLNSEFATHSPLRLSFEGVDRGKWIYFAARWENTRGVKGPWTEIAGTLIP
jgi:hypothetical protein